MKIKVKELVSDEYGLSEKYHDRVYYFRKKVVNVQENVIDDFYNIELEDGSICYVVPANKELDMVEL